MSDYPYIENNQTRYSSEDINAIVAAMVNSLTSDLKVSPRKLTVRYWNGGTTKRRWVYPHATLGLSEKGPWYTADPYGKAEGVSIVSPKRLTEMISPAEALGVAGLGEEGQVLPPSVMPQVLFAVLIQAGIRRASYTQRKSESDLLARYALGTCGHMRVRVMPSIEDPANTVKNPPEVVLANKIEVYTRGSYQRQLGYAMSNITSRIEDYEKNWRKLEKQKAKIEKMGGTVPHRYLTPAEVLRQTADEIEKRWVEEALAAKKEDT